MADLSPLGRVAPLGPGDVPDNEALAFLPFLGLVKVQVAGERSEAVLALALGTALPQPGAAVPIGPIDCLWLAPGEYLLVGDEHAVGATAGEVQEKLAGTLNMVTDMTHARAAFVLSGTDARNALAAHCPLDLSDAGFAVGDVARSLLGDCGVLVQRLASRENGAAFRIIVDQTMAHYAVRLLAGT
jgi:sarcosine oxidase subunit gamma